MLMDDVWEMQPTLLSCSAGRLNCNFYPRQGNAKFDAKVILLSKKTTLLIKFCFFHENLFYVYNILGFSDDTFEIVDFPMKFQFTNEVTYITIFDTIISYIII